MNPGKLLIIGKNWPEPLATAAGARMLQLISCFKEAGYTIIFASTALPAALSADLAEYLQAGEQIRLNDNSFDSWIRDLQPSLVLFDRFMIEEQFGWRVAEQLPSAVRLLDTEDLHSLRMVRKEGLGKNRPFAISDWLSHECTLRELASIYRCDLSLIISTYEMQLLTGHAGTNNNLLQHLPFMFDPVTFHGLPSYEQRQGFIFIGNGLHSPNTDATLWLKSEIWPHIRRELPDASIDICGAYLPERIKDLHDPGQGFHVKGWVEDASAKMQNARVQLAPLRFGAGVKGKLADGMRWGTPSVTTSVGAEGMHGNLPWAGSIANSPAEFAKEAVRLYKNARAWGEAQLQGGEIINTLYSKSAHGSSLIAAIASLRENLKQHRAGNVVGAILQHDRQASTKYMSKWIEAKNALQSGKLV
jgi:hypothetical protein